MSFSRRTAVYQSRPSVDTSFAMESAPFAKPDSLNVDLMGALRDLLANGSYSDLTIICGQKRYSVHRSLLSARSNFFDGAVRNPFKESRTGIIDLSQDDPEAVEHMIDYFYNLDYLRPRSSSPRSRALTMESLTSASTITEDDRPVSPVSLASSPTLSQASFSPTRKRKLNLGLVEDPLLAMAANNAPKLPESPFLTRFGPTSPLTTFDSVALPVKRPEMPAPIDTFIPESSSPLNMYEVDDDVPDQELDPTQPHLLTHAKVYALAEQYGIRNLKTLAKKKFAAQVAHHRHSPEFPPALREVYETTIDTDRGLRDVMVRTFRQHPELAQLKPVEDVVKETPRLAWELFRVGWGLPI